MDELLFPVVIEMSITEMKDLSNWAAEHNQTVQSIVMDTLRNAMAA